MCCNSDVVKTDDSVLRDTANVGGLGRRHNSTGNIHGSHMQWRD
jgi:hypothetical protein